MTEGPSLGDLGEAELIRRLGAFAPPGQFLDDAAVLATIPSGFQLVVNTDVLVEGIHFSESTTAPVDVGWRAAAANLSDLAAMGCQDVLGLTVGLVAPPNTPWSWVEGVYEGLSDVLRRYGGSLLGGDCSGGDQRLLAITALGCLYGGEDAVIRRGDGRPGDSLVSTGPHGLSRLGLALLKGEFRGEDRPRLPGELCERAKEAHRHPRPRLDATAALKASRPTGYPWRVGGCDSSDGLAAAVAAVAATSGCGARLRRDRLPMASGMEGLPQAEDWCLSGGEDFELVLALEPPWATALVATLPGATEIGELVAGSEAVPAIRWADNDDPLASRGFEHFR